MKSLFSLCVAMVFGFLTGCGGGGGSATGPVSEAVTVTGTTTSNATLTITGTAVGNKNVDGTLTVTGPVTVTSPVTVTAVPTNPVTVNTGLGSSVTGTAIAPVTVTGAVSGPITVTGQVTVTSATTTTSNTGTVIANIVDTKSNFGSATITTTPTLTPATTPTDITVSVTVIGTVVGPVTVTGKVNGPLTVVSSVPVSAPTAAGPPGAVSLESCPLPYTISGSVGLAMRSGNALSGASSDDLLNSAIGTIEFHRTINSSVVTNLYNLNSDGTAKADGSSLTAVSWNPRHDTALLKATFGVNSEVVLSNAASGNSTSTEHGLAIAGTTNSQSRYLVLGSNPFRTDPARGNSNVVNTQMEQFLKNSIQWLSGKPRGSAFKVALVHLDDSYWFKDESTTRAWLTKQYGSKVSLNAPKSYDGVNLLKVLADGVDLVIVSQQLDAGQDATQIRNGIKDIMDAGIPVLYLQRDGNLNDLGIKLFDLLQVQYVGDNNFSNVLSNNFEGARLVGRLPTDINAIREMLTRMVSGVYSFTLPQIAEDNTLGAFQSEFLNGAQNVRTIFQRYDNNALDIFQACGREIPKLLALAGDRIRQDISYPLSTTKSNNKEFLRAYYADHAVYNYRRINPAQKDLGTFSRVDFNGVHPVVRIINVVSRPSFRATGAYAQPGQTFKVTRLDANPVATSIFVNSVRTGSTQMWDDTRFGGYARPKFLRSNSVPLKPGESIYFTNPYGGPIQVSFDKKDIQVQLKLENVTEHPYWSGPQDDASFAAKLAANKHDWVEVATEGFEMHSKIDRFKNETLADPNWNTPAKLAAATQRYTYNYSHILAGFQGDGIEKEPEVYGWAIGKGLNLPTTDTVKHMNADVPSCGWGCSGNPYDAGWAFKPTGHGDLHELGHSLQSERWQLTHGVHMYPNHAGTNFYAYYSQSRAFDELGVSNGVQGMPFEQLYKQLQLAFQSGDRVGTVSAVMEKYFSDALAAGEDAIYNSYAFYTQFMMQVRKKGQLKNGWHMMGRIHVIDRSFNAALKDQETWEASKSGLGFTQVSFAEAKTMTNNDFMAIAMSFSTGLDIRDYMAMWGFRISTMASNQIASFNLPSAERVYFVMARDGWVRGALTSKVADFSIVKIDGASLWPLDTTIALNKTTFAIKEAIILSYVNPDLADRDWVGVYPTGVTPGGSINYLSRQTIPSVKNGILNVPGLAKAGDYVAYIFANNGYGVLAQVPFRVE